MSEELPRRKLSRAKVSQAANRTASIESLEPRRLMSVNVVVHHGDQANDGANLAETVLTPANVNATDFGKLFTTTLDGQVYAQPLYLQNVNVTRITGLGVHSVAYVATMHDSLYAVDANTGVILWQDSFLNLTDPTRLAATIGVTTIPSAAIESTVVGPELGILATPTIDVSAGIVYLNAATREVRSDGTHYVQRLWAVRASNGGKVAQTVIGDTLLNGNRFGSHTGYQYVAGPIVNGTGNNKPTGPTPTYPNIDGWKSAPGGASGYVIAFNALLQMERTAVTLINGTVYLGFASHGDQGGYYGWLIGYTASNLQLNAAFVTAPTYEGIVGNREAYTAQAGIWMSGSAIATDGTYLYVVTGNGAFNPAKSNFDAQGFPIDHDYGDAVLKLAVDPASSPTSQNGNGWGLKVADYFVPSNENQMNIEDLDLGSGGVLVLPDSLKDKAGNPMLVVGGKESRIYLLDRNNLGKFNFDYPADTNPDPRAYDRVLGEYPNNGLNTGGHEIYSTAAYLNGRFYIGAQTDPALAFTVSNFATGSIPPGTTPALQPVQKTAVVFGYPGPTFTITANGNSNGIVWGLNVHRTPNDDLLAYSANQFTTPIYDSNTHYSRDALTGDAALAEGVKFSLPTAANGMVYAATGSGSTQSIGTFVGYGLLSTYLKSNPAFFGAPTGLTVSATAAGAHLVWTSHASLATEFRIDRSSNGSTWSVLSYASNSARTYDDSSAGTVKYFYRVVAISGANQTTASNTARLPTAASIAGNVFNDANGNGKPNTGEAGLAGWRVFIDTNANGVWDSNSEASAVADSAGNYKLTGLAAGTYVVRVVRPAGWKQTSPANNFGQHITLSAGQSATGKSFGEMHA